MNHPYTQPPRRGPALPGAFRADAGDHLRSALRDPVAGATALVLGSRTVSRSRRAAAASARRAGACSAPTCAEHR